MHGDSQPPPFVFPLRAESWPVHDADAGVAFPKGGMHGAFHAGVVHAFVLVEGAVAAGVLERVLPGAGRCELHGGLRGGCPGDSG